VSQQHSTDQALLVTLPKVFLLDVPSDNVQLTLPELDLQAKPWPELVTLEVYKNDGGEAVLVHKQVLNTTSESGHSNQPKLTHNVDKLTINDFGTVELLFVVDGAPECKCTAFVIWAWLSLLPAIVTLTIAVAVKQVVLALLMGIWTGMRGHARWWR
jgi:hypothetical protein